MKTIHKILIFVLFPFQIFGQSETSSAMKESVVTDYNSLERSFVSEELSNREIFAFESRAIQKLNDFVGYLCIISNSDYDKSLREYTLNQATELFSDEEIIIYETDENSEIYNYNLDEYLNTFYNRKNARVEFEIEDATTAKSLELNTYNTYKGEIEFIQHITYYDDENNSKEITLNKKVEIILTKVEKNFGIETKNVWQIFIGNIYIVE
jgi:hypothetical protein